MANARKSSTIVTQAMGSLEPVDLSEAREIFPRSVDALDATDLVSPARAQQAWLEAALASGEPPKFSYGARMALIVGGSGVLWLCVGAIAAAALR